MQTGMTGSGGGAARWCAGLSAQLLSASLERLDYIASQHQCNEYGLFQVAVGQLRLTYITTILLGTLGFRPPARQGAALGLKVMIDQVLSHCSIDHRMLRESPSRDNPKAELVRVGGARTGAHRPQQLAVDCWRGCSWKSSISSQPDLNFHNPEVRAAQLDDLGLAGPRRRRQLILCTTRNCATTRPSPPELRTTGTRTIRTRSRCRYYNNTQPENLGLEDVRAAGPLPDVGNISRGSAGHHRRVCCNERRLHMGYSFEVGQESSATYIRATVDDEGWPCWATADHDVQRAVTRWGRDTRAAPPPTRWPGNWWRWCVRCAPSPGRGARPHRSRSTCRSRR